MDEILPGIQVQVRPAGKSDLTFLERIFPCGIPDKHADRLQRQVRGSVVYLLACYGEKLVGHGLLKWEGATEEPIATYLNGQCPDIEDLYVSKNVRSQGVGRQILRTAECIVQERGYPQIGLSVGIENSRARILYEKLGYKETPCGEHLERGEYVDSAGQAQMWEERCIYLVKQLISQT